MPEVQMQEKHFDAFESDSSFVWHKDSNQLPVVKLNVG